MKKVIYYLILVVLVACALIAVPAIIDLSGGNLEAPGVKGLTAGVGLAVLASRKRLFKWFDRKFKWTDYGQKGS